MSMNFDASELISLGSAASGAASALKREMRIASATALTEGVGLMQGFAPVDQGFLRGSIDISEGPTASGGAFGTGIIYARIQDEGGTVTGNPWLVFQIAGRWVKVHSVTIPGSRYKQRTVAALRPRVQRLYAEAVQRAMAVFGQAAD